MRTPPPHPLIPFQQRGQNTLLSRSVYQPRNTGWYSSGGNGRVDCVGRQDGSVAPVEGVGIKEGKIVPIADHWWDEVLGSGWD